MSTITAPTLPPSTNDSCAPHTPSHSPFWHFLSPWQYPIIINRNTRQMRISPRSRIKRSVAPLPDPPGRRITPQAYIFLNTAPVNILARRACCYSVVWISNFVFVISLPPIAAWRTTRPLCLPLQLYPALFKQQDRLITHSTDNKAMTAKWENSSNFLYNLAH
mgnify:FL=1